MTKKKLPSAKASTVDLPSGELVTHVVDSNFVDVCGVFELVCTPGQAAKFTAAHFPDTEPGCKRIQWEGTTNGKGRVVSRADLVARKLRWFRRGKCQASLKLADALDAAFPKAPLESMYRDSQAVALEDIDTSTMSLSKSTAIVPSCTQLQRSVTEEISKQMVSSLPEEQWNALQTLGFQCQKADMERERRVKDTQAKELEKQAANRTKVEMYKEKIKTATELGDNEMAGRLKRRFEEM